MMDPLLPAEDDARLAFICEHIRAIVRRPAGEDTRVNHDVEVLLHWQFSPTAVQDCFAILASATEHVFFFIAVKIMQERVRNAFSDYPPEVIDAIAQAMKALIVRVPAPSLLAIDDALITYCEIITIKGDELFDEEWIAALGRTPEISIRFWAHLFECANGRHWKKWEGRTDTIQRRLVPVGLNILRASPLCVFWLRMLVAIAADLANFEELIPLIPRLHEAIQSRAMIRILIDFAANIYAYNLSESAISLEFMIAFIEFTAVFSARLRDLVNRIGGNEELETLLFCFWCSFFQLNDEIIGTDDYVAPMNAALTEFLVCTSECRINEEVMRSLLSDAWQCLAYFFAPHPLHSIVPVFFQLCVTLLNNGIAEDALIDTVPRFAVDAPTALLEFVSAYMSEHRAPDRGIIIMVAENMAALTRRPETKELGESFGERFAQLLLSTPINHDCVFTFLNNFAALDVCDGYVGQMTVWLHRMFPTDPVRASDALLQLAIRRSGILLTQHADAVPAFAAFLPGLSFPEQSANLVAALICLVSVAPNPEPLGGICMAIGDHLIQSIATVVRQQNIRECTKLMVAFHTMVEIVPEIAEGSMVRRFTDSLVNSILRGFGDILIINDDTDAAFQGELCRFIALALARGWMNDLAIIIDWCEGMICAELATVHHFMVFPFLPIEQMPATATFLRELQVTDSADFNQLLIPLLKGFAERGVFTAFFQPQIVFQLINFAWPGPKDAVAMDVLFPILEKNLVPESEFYTACFEFLLGFGFRFRVPCIHHKIADLLTLIASKFEDRTPLKTIVAACCDANATIVKEFVSAVIDRQPPDVHRTAAEQLYRAFVMT